MKAAVQRIPIGERESGRLEFKAAAALAQPEKIAREVVALLNSGRGGEVWVGLREEESVAVAVEPIPEAEAAARRLHDSLIDTIEPSPKDEELRVDVVGTETPVLRLVVSGSRRSEPYAVLQPGGGRLFVVRVGARVRPLTREEILGQTDRQERDRSERLEEDLKNASSLPEPTLWLGIEPADAASRLDLDRLRSSDYLVEPESTGNRHGRRTFYSMRQLASLDNSRFLTIQGSPDGLRVLLARGGDFELRIAESGGLRAAAPLKEGFTVSGGLPSRLDVLRGETVLDPRYLIEYPTSVLRLISSLLRNGQFWKQGTPPSFWAALALIGIDGWFLRPDPDHPYLDPHLPDPRTLRLRPPETWWRAKPHSGDILQVGPVPFSGEDLAAEPDDCSYRLLRAVFAAFGYAEDEIRAFDPRTRMFHF